MSMSNALDDSVRKADQIRHQVVSLASRVELQRQESLRRRAGSTLGAMRCSRDGAESMLRHSDEQVRGVALEILADEWRVVDDRFVQCCMEMAEGDPDKEVRSIAVVCLVKCYTATHEPRIGTWLVTFICDSSVPRDVR